MPQRYLLKEITIIMISTSITLFCLMKMLDKHIICIIVLVQLFVSCLVNCVNCITTRCYVSPSDP